MSGKIKFFITSIFLIICCNTAFAMDMTEVDALIEERRFNEALLILEEMLRASPDSFDIIEKRIGYIREERKKYGELAEDLIKLIETNPLETSKQIELIQKLEAIEPNPGEEEREFLERAKDVAMFAHIRRSYERIMREGGELLNQHNFVAAVRKFEEGLDLNREEFESKNLEPEVREAVADAVVKLRTELIPEYEQLQEALIPAVDNFTEAVRKEDFDEANRLFPGVERQMRNFAELCNKVAGVGSIFYIHQQAILSVEPYYSPMAHIPILYKMTVSEKMDTKNGIFGSLERQWFYLCNKMKGAVTERLDARWDDVMAAIEEEGLFTYPATHEVPRKTLPSDRHLTTLGKDINELHEFRKFPLGTQPHYFSEFDTAMDAYRSLSECMYDNLVNVQKLVEDKNNVEIETTDENRKEKLDFLHKFLQTAQTVATQTANIQNRLSQIDRNYQSENIHEVSLDTPLVDNYVASAVSRTLELANGEAEEAWQNMAGFLAETCVFFLDKYKVIYEKALSYYNGHREEDSGLLLKFPAEALEELQPVISNLTEDANFLDSKLQVAKTAPNEIAKTDDYTQDVTQSEMNIAEMRNLFGLSTDLASKSRDATRRAAEEEEKGDNRYRRAQAALERDNFQETRNLIQQSRMAYTESLSIQHSETLREESDKRLRDLSLLLTDRENELIVREVRQLYTQALNEYRVANYENAEQLLLRARVRWATTNTIPHQEVERLLQLVGRALSMKIGRSVPPNAPLYPEMSQLLNIAVNNYGLGKSLVDRKKIEEAMPYLNLSTEKIEEIRLVYPNHQIASLLSLRIQQLLDPEQFDRDFDEWVKNARETYQVEGMAESAYILLQDLVEINPDYPGLKQLIYDIELHLGIRQRPPDRTAYNLSMELTEAARKAVDSISEIEIRVALSQLDDALTLNPDNTEAIALKDRLQIKIGGQSVAVLSAESEALYQQAIRALQVNNVIEATALLNRLLQNSDAQLSTKVQQLQQRIKILTE